MRWDVAWIASAGIVVAVNLGVLPSWRGDYPSAPRIYAAWILGILSLVVLLLAALGMLP